MKVTFIGGGNMATALISGLTSKGHSAGDIHVVEIDAAARKRLSEALGVHAHEKAAAGVAGAECVVLAVKPQHMLEVARELKGSLGQALVVSIAAGIRWSDLSRWLGGHRRLVRAMPNTPALVLAGITGLYAPPEVSTDDRDTAARILGAAGETLWVGSEEEMDAITAVSGSGPAYVFDFLEALEKAAAELGFDARAAHALAIQTFTGAVKLAAESADTPATLRARVTSKGGTTERAISELERLEVAKAIVAAVKAAADRSRELGDALGRQATEAGGG